MIVTIFHLSPISRSKSNQSINDSINSGDQKLARKRTNSGKGLRGGHTKIQRRESEVAPPASILDPRRTIQVSMRWMNSSSYGYYNIMFLTKG